MVYRQPGRDPAPTGRCGSGAAGTDAVVESHRIACSHFDAFRFFTPTARPLNTLQPGPRRPGRVRAAGLPACRDGPLQARLPAHADDLLATWSPTASSWPATSACSTCARRRTTSPTSASSRCGSRRPRARRRTPRRSARFAERGRRCGARLIDGVRAPAPGPRDLQSSQSAPTSAGPRRAGRRATRRPCSTHRRSPREMRPWACWWCRSSTSFHSRRPSGQIIRSRPWSSVS